MKKSNGQQESQRIMTLMKVSAFSARDVENKQEIATQEKEDENCKRFGRSLFSSLDLIHFVDSFLTNQKPSVSLQSVESNQEHTQFIQRKIVRRTIEFPTDIEMVYLFLGYQKKRSHVFEKTQSLSFLSFFINTPKNNTEACALAVSFSPALPQIPRISF